jgi:hypothetical protein
MDMRAREALALGNISPAFTANAESQCIKMVLGLGRAHRGNLSRSALAAPMHVDRQTHILRLHHYYGHISIRAPATPAKRKFEHFFTIFQFNFRCYFIPSCVCIHFHTSVFIFIIFLGA